jgi:hypothetical protein
MKKWKNDYSSKEEEEVEGGQKKKKTLEYLLSMKIAKANCTLSKLENEERENNKKIEKLKNLTKEKMWLKDLNSLKNWINHKRQKQRKRKRKRHRNMVTVFFWW